MLSSKSNDTIKLAIKDFKDSCFKEKDKNKLFDPFKNLINSSVIFFDNEFRNNENELSINFFDDIFTLFNENKNFFEKDFKLMWAFAKVIKRTSSTKKTIEHLEKIINLNLDTDAIASYNFFNNYLYDWSQSDYLNKILKKN